MKIFVNGNTAHISTHGLLQVVKARHIYKGLFIKYEFALEAYENFGQFWVGGEGMEKKVTSKFNIIKD